MQRFSLEPVLPPLTARPDHVERALKACYHDAMSKLQPQCKELELLIVILPDNNGSLYGINLSLYYIILHTILISYNLIFHLVPYISFSDAGCCILSVLSLN